MRSRIGRWSRTIATRPKLVRKRQISPRLETTRLLSHLRPIRRRSHHSNRKSSRQKVIHRRRSLELPKIRMPRRTRPRTRTIRPPARVATRVKKAAKVRRTGHRNLGAVVRKERATARTLARVSKPGEIQNRTQPDRIWKGRETVQAQVLDQQRIQPLTDRLVIRRAREDLEAETLATARQLPDPTAG